MEQTEFTDLETAIALLVRAYGDLDASHTAIIVGDDAAPLLRDIGSFLREYGVFLSRAHALSAS